MRLATVLLMTLIAAFPCVAADNPFTNVVHCHWSDKPKCDENIVVSGAETSTILIDHIPDGPVTFVLPPGQDGADQVIVKDCAPTPTMQILIQKTRGIVPVWMRTVARTFAAASGKRVTAAVVTPKCENLRFVTDGTSPDFTFTAAGQTFSILMRDQKWWLESGGVYAFSWARDEQLVTQNVTVGNSPKVQVIDKRNGDRIGPSTGVTFVFHPADFPEFGWEFATSTNNTKTNYYLGGTVRLIQFNDRALLTIGAGLSHVAVTQYPNVTTTDSAGAIRYYETNDPLLAGRNHYIDRPYISLGLGINLGGAGSGKTQ